jgi:mono/diheme cytochrome c family protein
MPPSRAIKLVVGLCLLASSTACRQDMHDQPRYRTLRESHFFANTSSARPLVEGTIARGTLQTDAAFFTGKNGALFVNELPFPATEAVLNRGQERFNIYCSPCHGQTGAGNGLVVQRGYPTPPSFHIDRLRNIVAYIRALQLAGHANKGDLPEGVTDPAEAQKKAAEATAKPSGHK